MGNGPLNGVKIVEVAGLGPTPFAAMVLADMGAEIIRIERPGNKHLLGLEYDILNRGRGFVELDLKSEDGKATARRLIAQADGLIEGMRPGVMERLGLGPDDLQSFNPRLVYGRMTGWGQDGPLAHAAGHDINYIALSGALHAIGPAEAPVPPLNLLGDFGGGGMYLALGLVCAMFEAKTSGKGQVVDAAITDGTAHLMSMIYALRQGGHWQDKRGANLLDGAAPFYGTYRCKCGGFVAIGALEPKFYNELLQRVGLSLADLPNRNDPANWPSLRSALEDAFSTKSRAEWSAEMEGTDVCFAQVLTIDEAASHPHNIARDTFVTVDGHEQPAPTPKLSRTPGAISPSSQSMPLDPEAVLANWGA
ncbi:CaiB/BaiF CoA transferase family protein [Actibacterium lipolyticum]|uniref:E-cinnamoyl-CoA:R-phenyllactate CoA transferase n=1 Tax=Actibacterium lipolyticum TaxID=1524263 RepID=A0A238KFS1_9RHOB|nr:CaiB/BaiF CoA-transferase family protein [Actibacterium lipolyticum]SMX41709.1 E-cinnamoyl-CoA:R-phenyllactate CoA transferase [Actibacterium lipolyticum]